MLERISSIAIAAVILAVFPTPASAAGFVGPGRFCGYSPIIDLKDGEKVLPTSGGVHGGTFIWSGKFGKLDVNGTGWARRPRGRSLKKLTSRGHIRFRQRRDDDQYVVAIWNGKRGAAYFSSPKRLTNAQLGAIDRVDLYNEGEEPEGCKYRTVFVWD